jgi:hypothetical protein
MKATRHIYLGNQNFGSGADPSYVRAFSCHCCSRENRDDDDPPAQQIKENLAWQCEKESKQVDIVADLLLQLGGSSARDLGRFSFGRPYCYLLQRR